MTAPETSQPKAWRLYTEAEDGSTVILETRPFRGYGRRFLTMFQPTLSTMSRMDRPSCYWRALMHLLTVLDPIQFRAVSARELASGASLSVSSAERALAMLEADRVVIAQGRTAARRLRLSNNLAWMSRADRFEEAEPDMPVEDGRGR